MKQRVINKSIVLLVFFMNYLFGGWISLRAPSNDADICEWSFISPDTGFIAQYYSLWKTTDGGITYQSVGPYGDTGYYVYPIQVVDINTCYFLYYNFCDTAFIWKTPDGGTSWECMLKLDGMTQSYPFSIFFLNPNYGYIVVPKDTNILKTTDGGENWIAQTSGSDGFLTDVFFTDTSTGYVVGEQGTILKTTDGGVNWIRQVGCSSAYLLSLHFTDAKIGYAVGEPGVILKTTSGGATGIGDQFADESDISQHISHLQNYPNPVNTSTTISFKLPSRSFVLLKIFNLTGKEISILVSEDLPAGNHSLQWKTGNLPGGVYFCQLQSGSFTVTKKLVLLR